MPRAKPITQPSEPQQTEMPPPYNLWTESWITLERFTGEMEQHSIKFTLLHAHEFRSIHDPSPLVVVGIHRLLTAILQDALDPQDEDELRILWHANGFPDDKIKGFGERYADRFDLFSTDKPFLQSGDLPLTPLRGDNTKSVAALFPEIPAGTEVTHYHHGVEDENVFSPAAAAAGLVAMPAFASSGGAGIKPSINGVPPIYVLPGGKSLFESLVAALLLPIFRPTVASRKRDDVWWRREVLVERSKELTEVGYLHSLTFPARRVRLHPIKVNTICTRSGRFTEWGVRTMVFEMGESRPKDAPWWQDPFAAYRLPEEKKTSRRAQTGTAKKKSQPTPIRPQQGKAAWREFGGLFIQQATEARRTVRPLFIEQMAQLELAGDRSSYPFRCIGIQTDGKAKNFEWIDFGFDVPPSLLHDINGALQIDKALVFTNDCGGIIAFVFARHFGGNSRKSQRHLTLKNRMMDGYWAALADNFRHLILALGDQKAQSEAFQIWIDTVVKTAITVFSQAAETVGDDAANLRLRTEAEQNCRKQLYTRKKKETPNE